MTSLEDEEEDVNTVTKTNKEGSEETVEKKKKVYLRKF